MNLWPFSKKTNPNPIQAQRNGKMELPPGVMLASPDEQDLPSEQPAPVAVNTEPESATPSELSAPEAHSLEDLALLPPTEAASATDEPKDLSGFFEKHQLEMISTGSQPGAMPQENLPEMDNAETHQKTTIAHVIGSESHSLSLEPDQLFLPPEIAHASEDELFLGPDLPAPETASPLNVLGPAFTSPDFTLAPESNSGSSPADPETSQSEYLSFETAGNQPPPSNEESTSLEWGNLVAEMPTGGITPPTSSTRSLSDEQSPLDDAFQTSATEQSLMGEVPAFTEQAPMPFSLNPESSDSNTSENLDNFYLFPTQNMAEAAEMSSSTLFGGFSDPLDPATELSPMDHWMSSVQTEPPSLTQQENSSLPTQPDIQTQDAMDYGFQLSPNDLDFNNLENLAANFEPHSDSPAQGLTEPLPDTLNDETFDLDSLLLGAADPVEIPWQPALSTDMDLTSKKGDDNVEPTDTDILDHYFGDEAQGLKGNDNLESYDFGHYEDPDDPAQAFVLDEEPASSILNNLSYDQYYSAPENELSFSAKLAATDEDSDPEEQNAKAASDSNPISFLFGSENTDEPTESQDRPEVDSITPQSNPEPPELTAEKIAEQTALASSKPASEPAPPHSDSISDVINTFSQDILLHNNRFLGRSIDRLVDAYFAQRNQNSG